MLYPSKILENKRSNTFSEFKKLCKRLMIKKEKTIGAIVRIRSDYGKEFENQDFVEFCDKESVSHEFSTAQTS